MINKICTWLNIYLALFFFKGLIVGEFKRLVRVIFLVHIGVVLDLVGHKFFHPENHAAYFNPFAASEHKSILMVPNFLIPYDKPEFVRIFFCLFAEMDSNRIDCRCQIPLLALLTPLSWRIL